MEVFTFDNEIAYRDLKLNSVSTLKKLAKYRGLRKVSKLNKQQLIDLLEQPISPRTPPRKTKSPRTPPGAPRKPRSPNSILTSMSPYSRVSGELSPGYSITLSPISPRTPPRPLSSPTLNM